MTDTATSTLTPPLPNALRALAVAPVGLATFVVILLLAAFAVRLGLVADDTLRLWAGASTAADGEVPIGRIVAAYPTLPFTITTLVAWIAPADAPAPALVAAALLAIFAVTCFVLFRKAGLPLVAAIVALQFAPQPWCLLSIVPLILLLWLISFFRNPPRRIPDDPRSIVSPADGLVVDQRIAQKCERSSLVENATAVLGVAAADHEAGNRNDRRCARDIEHPAQSARAYGDLPSRPFDGQALGNRQLAARQTDGLAAQAGGEVDGLTGLRSGDGGAERPRSAVGRTGHGHRAQDQPAFQILQPG